MDEGGLCKGDQGRLFGWMKEDCLKGIKEDYSSG